jgi:hypothetical protein
MLLLNHQHHLTGPTSPPLPPNQPPTTNQQVNLIEKAKTDRTDKPLEDIKIVNIDLLDAVQEG